jgi:hypothetical protein
MTAKPNPQDQRRESFRPVMDTMVTERHLEPWKPRRDLLDEYVEDSMCRLNRDARADANAQSLALVRPVVAGQLTEVDRVQADPASPLQVGTQPGNTDRLAVTLRQLGGPPSPVINTCSRTAWPAAGLGSGPPSGGPNSDICVMPKPRSSRLVTSRLPIDRLSCLRAMWKR